jgi:3',5'-cyclic AMP phosphodiesterase CpdA
MQIVLIQLSDIHLQDRDNWIEDKGRSIARAAIAVSPDCRVWVIVLSGDIAYSGGPEQYKRAQRLISDVAEELRASVTDAEIRIVGVPGNHDCHFGLQTDVRPMLTGSMASQVDAIRLDGDAVTQCTSVQEPFFDFLKSIGAPYPGCASERVYQRQAYECGGHTLVFHCYNTAWVSQLHESEGKLVYPTRAVEEKALSAEHSDLAISVLHHPLNWFSNENGRAFRELLDKTSDLVFTGHEHVGSAFARRMYTGEEVHHVEGCVLQQADQGDSGFTAVVIDLAARKHRIVQLAWEGNQYLNRGETLWLPFCGNRLVPERREHDEAHRRV